VWGIKAKSLVDRSCSQFMCGFFLCSSWFHEKLKVPPIISRFQCVTHGCCWKTSIHHSQGTVSAPLLSRYPLPARIPFLTSIHWAVLPPQNTGCESRGTEAGNAE
jgi:hypothetical protein